jgi:cysteinyl-tRNA synthetase
VNSLLKHTNSIFGILEDLKQDKCVREKREKKGFEEQKVDERLLELLINLREKARKAKHYDISDYIREELAKLGVILEDTPAGTKWKLQR